MGLPDLLSSVSGWDVAELRQPSTSSRISIRRVLTGPKPLRRWRPRGGTGGAPSLPGRAARDTRGGAADPVAPARAWAGAACDRRRLPRPAHGRTAWLLATDDPRRSPAPPGSPATPGGYGPPGHKGRAERSRERPYFVTWMGPPGFEPGTNG